MLRTKEALFRYALDPRTKFNTQSVIESGVHEVISSLEFWSDIEALARILQPVHEAQKMSESQMAHLGHVIKRWDDILMEWQKLLSTGQYPQLHNVIEDVWASRHTKQHNELTWLAWALDPANEGRAKMMPSTQQTILGALRKYTPPDEHAEMLEDYFAFRDVQGKFGHHRDDIWTVDFTSKPVLFWKLASVDAKALSGVAQRVFSSPANSVPSERSFSAMNFIQDDFRSRLSADKTDKLTFIYMNSKVLRRTKDDKVPAWYNIGEEDEEALEDLAFSYVSRCESGDDDVSRGENGAR